jgi:hypothetical protein
VYIENINIEVLVMPVVNMTRRLPDKTLGADIDSLNGLGTVEGYTPVREDASPKNSRPASAPCRPSRKKRPSCR